MRPVGGSCGALPDGWRNETRASMWNAVLGKGGVPPIGNVPGGFLVSFF